MSKTCVSCIFWKKTPAAGKRMGGCSKHSPKVDIINGLGMIRKGLGLVTCMSSSCREHVDKEE